MSIFESIGEQNRLSASSSERWTLETLADYASVSDAVIAGKVVSLDGFSQLVGPDGSVVNFGGAAAQIAHFSVEVSTVLYGELAAGEREGEVIPFVMLVSPPLPADGELTAPVDWADQLEQNAVLPGYEVILSLVRSDDPALEKSGFFGEYSLSSTSRGLISMSDGTYGAPLGSDIDADWAAATFPKGSLDVVSTALNDAVAECNAAAACLTQDLDSSGEPIVGIVSTG